jgi:hypothetical protein
MGLIVFYMVSWILPTFIMINIMVGINVNGLVRVGLYWTSRSKTSPYANDLIGLERNL